MRPHLLEAWRKVIASFDPPLYQSGLDVGDRVIITHPDLGGAEVEGTVTGEIPVSGLLMVQISGIDGLVQVPLSMVRAAKVGYTFREDGEGVDRGQYNGYIQAWDGMTLAGYLDYAIWLGDERDTLGNTAGDKLFISMVEVMPEYRRQGLATQLLDEVIKRQYTDWGRKPPEVLPGLLTDQGAQWWPSVEHKYASAGSELSWAGLISVAEQTMERAGQVGRRWHLPNTSDFTFENEFGPQNGRYNPAYKAEIRPLEEFVAQVVGDDYYVGSGQVGYREWDLREAGNPLGMTDSMGNISLQLQTNDMTILHECAHVIQRTREGEGHDEAFARLARDLYARYISQEAADTFWGIIEMTGRTASTWRGFQEGEPFWKSADAVIATQRRGRQRYFETWVNGRNYGNFPRLDEAKAHIEKTYGTLDWQQVSMPLVWVEHYYFGWSDEWTDPLIVYYADF